MFEYAVYIASTKEMVKSTFLEQIFKTLRFLIQHSILLSGLRSDSLVTSALAQCPLGVAILGLQQSRMDKDVALR